LFPIASLYHLNPQIKQISYPSQPTLDTNLQPQLSKQTSH
jgi:hypothetical protein